MEMVNDKPLNSICNILEVEFTKSEVFLTTKNLKPYASSASYRNTNFIIYQQFWSIVVWKKKKKTVLEYSW